MGSCLVGIEKAGRRNLLRGAAILALVLVGAALIVWVAGRLVDSIDYHLLVHDVRHMSGKALAGSILATLASFAALICRENVVLGRLGQKLPLMAVGLAVHCGTSLSHVVGLGGLTGAAVRYRIYAAAGLRLDTIALLMLALAVGYDTALAVVGAGGIFAEAETLAPIFHLTPSVLRAEAGIGVAVLLLLALLIRDRALFWGAVRIRMPRLTLVSPSALFSALQFAAAAMALWCLLPMPTIGFPAFLTLFLAATAIGVISHIPGGLGVFETAMLLFLRQSGPAESVAAALLVYRAIYFVLPLIFSTAFLTIFELNGALARTAAEPRTRALRAAARLTPTFLAVLTFAAGIILVASSATPAFHGRLASLAATVPAWIIDASNLVAAMAGVILLFSARGLFHRLDGAWWLATLASGVAFFASFTKGLAYTEAALLGALLLLLLPARRQFTRRASLLNQPFTAAWMIAIAAVLAAACALFVVAFQHGCQDQACWWSMPFDAQQPRASRALVSVCVLSIALGVTSLLRAAKGVVEPADDSALDKAARIIAAQDRSDVLLALMGDKSFMFSTTGQSFLMYAKRGRSWIALFDPVGPASEWSDLVWDFVELAASHGGRAAFYQVRPESLPLYIDAGLNIVKLGEEARLSLTDFSLQGSRRTNLRYSLKRGERDGLTFELVAPEEAARFLPELRRLSDAWIAAHGGREKGFSVAAFSARYILAQYIALVRQNGLVVGFASVMTTPGRREATIGLMRHVPAASAYSMEFLFTRLILALKEGGFGVLSLGVAPLSGVSPTPLASRWYQVARLLWRHGTMLYNFKGLRTFKGKFDPVWEPRYLAVSGNLGPFFALADAAVLANGVAARRPRP
jgi:phosphatidylglycerol lysyltransferase